MTQVFRLGAFLAGMVLLSSPSIAAAPAPAEQDVDMKTESGVLWGTWSGTGAPPVATVLMLAGSGPTDRNGNSPTVHTDSLRLLAQDLAGRGIASLRADKRGIGASAAAGAVESDLRFQTYSDDAKAWVRFLMAAHGAKCVWLLGHSEGALVAEVAAQNNAGICGLILVSGAGRKAGDVIREQLNAKPKFPTVWKDAAFNTLSELEAGRTVAAPLPQLMGLFRPSVQPYLISWLALDPAVILASTRVPTMIVAGDNDLQIPLSDPERLKAARADAELVVIPGMNHILKVAPTDRAGNAATYGNPALPLAPGLSAAISDFIRVHSP